MRFLLSVIALLLLPVLTLAQLRYFQFHLQGPLEARIHAVLTADPELQWVQPSLDYLDVTLDNVVPNLAARERAEALIRRLGVVRMLPENNHLMVPARLEGRLDGEKITLTGMLHDQAALREVTRWLKSRRPGLEVEASGVEVSPYGTRLDLGDGDAGDPGIRNLWSQIVVSPSLKITREGSDFEMSGALPGEALRDAVAEALRSARVDARVNRKDLKVGAYVKEAAFTDAKALPEFLKRLFSLADSEQFEAEPRFIHFAANVTEAMYEEWQPLVNALRGEAALRAEWHVYPDVYHLPAYRPESKLEPAALAALQTALRHSVIRVEAEPVGVTTDEMPQINAAVQAITAAGPNARILVGAYIDPAGDPKASETVARKRVQAVIEQFLDRGLPAASFQAATYRPGPSQTGIDPRIIELILK